MIRILFLLAATVVLLSFALPSRASDLEQEYIQVRKIALKDPRVRDAFEKADERLNEKILEIDPALKPIVDRKQPMPVEAPKATIEHRQSTVAAPKARGPEHVVVKGETLTSIAGHYRVTVTSLERVNHITDERKLKVGQKLIIPTSVTPEPQPQPTPDAKPAENGSLLDWAKKNL